MVGFDAFLWQLLASVVIPGATIRLVVTLSSRLGSLGLSQKMVKSSSMVAGLAAIPLIIKPIDRAVDHIMDISIPSLDNVKISPVTWLRKEEKGSTNEEKAEMEEDEKDDKLT